MSVLKAEENRKQKFYNVLVFDPPLCVGNSAELCFCDESQAIMA